MTRAPFIATFLALALTLGATAASAQDFQAGWTAYEQGNYARAFKEWQPLAEAGAAAAQFNLGLMYHKGEGVPQDFAEAARWYRLAAEQELTKAQFNLGVMYDEGQGVPQDPAAAVRWYRHAAEQGFAPAQSLLGNKYFQGVGVIQDHVTAHMWLTIATSRGVEEALMMREIAAQFMSPEQVAEAQARARACVERNYKGC